MKKIFLFLFLLLSFLRMTAQISEKEQIYRSTNTVTYKQYTSIVRNYDDKYNVLMQYGYSINEGFSDTIKGRSSFMIQNTNTGDIVHLFDLPKGYQVNDVRFVTLRKINGVSTEDFCCFCGTRTQLDDIASTPVLPGETPQYIYVFSKHGFAGFFSMSEAINPSTSFTAKVRDVEQTKELYRMTCYAEERGYYYHNQNAFLDNAVLDIIGLDDTVNAPSCLCRAKFYPDYMGGVHWDNNMRYNNTEVLTDITKTDDYVVTSSNNVVGDSLWIRYSGQEDHLIYGGLDLNEYVNSIDFTSLVWHYSCNKELPFDQFYRSGPSRICHTTDNKIEICYGMTAQRFIGFLNSQYDYANNTLQFMQGVYTKWVPSIKELIHMPSNNATAVIFDDNYVSVLTWIKRPYPRCNYLSKWFWYDTIKVQSLTLQYRNGFEHLFWSGLGQTDPYSPMYLLSQRGEQGGGYDQTCHYTVDETATPITIEHSVEFNPMNIKKRYPYDDVTYPVTFINFSPQVITKDFPCILY